MCRAPRRGRVVIMIQTVITSVSILGIIIVGLLAVVPSVIDLRDGR